MCCDNSFAICACYMLAIWIYICMLAVKLLLTNPKSIFLTKKTFAAAEKRALVVFLGARTYLSCLLSAAVYLSLSFYTYLSCVCCRQAATRWRSKYLGQVAAVVTLCVSQLHYSVNRNCNSIDTICCLLSLVYKQKYLLTYLFNSGTN